MLRFALLVSILIPAAASSAQDPNEKKYTAAEAARMESPLLRRTRQLTFEGRRAGEGYFGPQGSRMVFQSERHSGNPFYQIYLMDLETGDTDRISPGSGKTTCAWIHPRADKVLFASTHGDQESVEKQKAEIAFRESGQERRYSWDYDEHYEIYEYDRSSQKYVNLTNARGYDAEGSWSPDGKLIAFASNRNAYSTELTAEEHKKFELDPAWAMDIFIMNADGTNVRQLTDVPGYDGGPFFSADGKKICWRRFSENGLTAEIMTMNIDGSGQRQITKMEAMSWAPFFHPSGEYLIYNTNIHGFGNFELYIVSADGGEPVRVTYTDKFDALASFTPDGNRLTWTSQRTSNGQSQIFLAEWDHAKARELLGLDRRDRSPRPITRVETRPEFAPADVVQHVNYLCRPELAGRMTGTKGAELATEYVANYFDALGLKPAGADGRWYQSFDFTAGAALGENNELAANGKPLSVEQDWRPVAFSGTGSFEPGGVVFAGYGIVAPKGEETEEYDSYVHLDVTDKWVVVFRFLPEDVEDNVRQQLSRPADLRFKAMTARDKGAKGLIIVTGPTAQARSELVPLRFDTSLAGTSLPVISVSNAVAAKWLKMADKDLGALQKKLDSGAMMMGFEIKGLKVGGTVDVRKVRSSGRNVLGRLQFGKQPSDEVVVIGAHIDHLGKGPSSSSLARDDERGGIHFGADDNASGVAAMLEVAEYFADNRDKLADKSRRDIIFAAWSGEELGLLGSDHFVKTYKLTKSPHAHGGHSAAAHGSHGSAGHSKNPHAPADATKNPHAPNPHPKAGDKHGGSQAKKSAAAATIHGKTGTAPSGANPHQATKAAGTQSHAHSAPPMIYPSVAACLNMDMVGRMEDKLVLQGIGSSDVWTGEIERRNAVVGLKLTLQEDCNLPTDASSFYKAGVPILSAFTGSHKDYHTPRDTPNKLNYEGAAQIARFMALITRALVLREDAPPYKVHTTQKEEGRRANLRAWLGTTPDYAEEVKGVLISGAAKNGPADKAGLKGGDVIVELAGRKIENIYDYTYAIEALKIGKETTITIVRDGKRIQFKVTPGSRD